MTKSKNMKQKMNKPMRKIVEESLSPTYLEFTSRIKLFNDLYNKYDKTKNQIRYLLKKSLSYLLNKNIVIKKKNSFRFSKLYFNKKNKVPSKNKKTKKVKKIAKLAPIKPKKQILNKKQKRKIKKDIKKIKNKLSNKLQNINLTGNNINYFPLSNTNTINNSKGDGKYKKSHMATWQYYDNNKSTSHKSLDNWYNYDPEASDIVEDAWQQYIVNRGMSDVRSVKSGEWEYTVDFMNWKQRNITHSAHTQREIRRLDPLGIVTKNPYANN